MSDEMELEGEWVMGWPDRKRARVMPSKRCRRADDIRTLPST